MKGFAQGHSALVTRPTTTSTSGLPAQNSLCRPKLHISPCPPWHPCPECRLPACQPLPAPTSPSFPPGNYFHLARPPGSYSFGNAALRPQGCQASADNHGDTWGRGVALQVRARGLWANVAAPRVQGLPFPGPCQAGAPLFRTPVLAWLLAGEALSREQLSVPEVGVGVSFPLARSTGARPMAPLPLPLQVAQVLGREAWLEGTAGEKWGPVRARPGDLGTTVRGFRKGSEQGSHSCKG